MENYLRYDFLKLEFRSLYDGIKTTIDDKNKENIFNNLNDILNEVIVVIYKINGIYKDKKLCFNENIIELTNIKLLDKEIGLKIISLSDKNKRFAEKYNSTQDCKIIDELFNCIDEQLFQIVIWLTVTYGKENYKLILKGLTIKDRELFDKYLADADHNSNKIIDLDNDERTLEVSKLVEDGERYYFGRGCPKDNRKALSYFIKAAEYGDEFAEAYIGLFYDKGYGIRRDYTKASKWYYKAAIKGNAFAQYSLGTLYLLGNGVSKCYEKALWWFQKSAESEYPAAYYQIAQIYYNGFGVDKDDKKAFLWYEQAALLDFPAAQHALSYMYKNGEGCEANVIKAYFWVEKAAENGFEESYYIVGKSYLDGIFYEKNYEKAFNYLKKGYESLDINCISELAYMYLNGFYVEKDVMTALELYNLSIEYGNEDLYYKLGKIYENLDLTDKAIDIYLAGHNKGVIKCTQRLGIMLYNGEGITRDIDRAIRYMQKAVEKKAPHAMYVLAIAYIRQNTFKEKTMDKAIELLKESYSLGCAYAAEYLAYILINRHKENIAIDYEELVKYIEYGVENNIVNSIFQYGYIYEKGIGVDQDYEKSYYYYKQAADDSCTKAINKLAFWCERGIFLAQNIDSSIRWYEKAAELNDIISIEHLIGIYELGIGGRENQVKAMYYLFKLIELDALKGKYKLAYYCFKGIGIEINKERGYELIEEVEAIDHGTSCRLKGFLGYEKLIDLTTDEIISQFKNGIELGNSDCYGNLAMFLYERNLYENEKYEDDFTLAMEGLELGINECVYVYLLKILRKIQKTSIITLEEIAVINKVKELVESGFNKGIKTLVEWYSTRNTEDKLSLYKYKQQAIFYNIDV